MTGAQFVAGDPIRFPDQELAACKRGGGTSQCADLGFRDHPEFIGLGFDELQKATIDFVGQNLAPDENG